ncbi:hypothetical protein BSL78_19722 [Apostichopus japonicus]|uniref:Uncharacterized protein n=1 Tax=Stichopus japonicus TaxID=307972 RepID=A0A2G8K5Z1_STIJA|nr:hypothetical protein BSL78_19722 [Apostichopus japonicus]
MLVKTKHGSVYKSSLFTGELNGKRRQHFDVAGASSPCLPQNTWEAPSNKRHCNGLDSLDGAGSELGIQDRTEELPEKMIIDETNTILQLQQNKNNRICQRCLAGEPVIINLYFMVILYLVWCFDPTVTSKL